MATCADYQQNEEQSAPQESVPEQSASEASLDADKLNAGHDEDFVGEVGEDFYCSICHLVLRDAQQLASCGHRICAPCLQEWRQHCTDKNVTFDCPLDRIAIQNDKIFPDLAAQRKVLSLQVKCENASLGCAWVEELRLVEQHKVNCGLVEVTCINGCGEIFPRSLIQSHVEICLHRLVDCPLKKVGCQRKVKACDVQDEHNHVELLQKDFQNQLAAQKVELTNEFSKGFQNQLAAQKIEMEIQLKKELDKQRKEFELKLVYEIKSLKLIMNNQIAKTETFTFSITDVISKLDGIRNEGADSVIISPEFYCRVPGYKSELTIDLNGHGTAEGTHVAIFVQLVTGEFDECREWPCKEVFHVRVKSQKAGVEDRVADVNMAEVPEAGARDATTGCGSITWISHQELSSFLTESKMTIECSV